MPPLQQFPAPAGQNSEQPDQSPYDFFMETQNQQKKKGPFGGGSKLWLFIIGGIILLLVIIGVVVAAIMSGNKDIGPELAVAQSQQEIIRVATDGAKNAKSGNLQNFAQTALLTVTSAQLEYQALLSRYGVKLDPKQLALGQNAQSDKALAAALNVNTYDTTFSSIMKSELDKYELKLNEVASKITDKKDQETIQKQNAGAQLLRAQLLAE